MESIWADIDKLGAVKVKVEQTSDDENEENQSESAREPPTIQPQPQIKVTPLQKLQNNPQINPIARVHPHHSSVMSPEQMEVVVPQNINPAQIILSRDPRLRKKLMEGSVSAEDIIVKTEPRETSQLPESIRIVRELCGNFLNAEPPQILQAPVLPKIEPMETEPAVARAVINNQSPLVTRPYNPVFITQATIDNVENAVAQCPVPSSSPGIRIISQRFGADIDDIVRETLDAVRISGTVYSGNKRSFGTDPDSSVTQDPPRSVTEKDTTDVGVQTTKNSGDVFITNDQYSKLDEHQRKIFNDLKKVMGIETETTISAAKERLNHRRANNNFNQRTGGETSDSIEKSINPPAPPRIRESGDSQNNFTHIATPPIPGPSRLPMSNSQQQRPNYQTFVERPRYQNRENRRSGSSYQRPNRNSRDHEEISVQVGQSSYSRNLYHSDDNRDGYMP